MLNENIGPDESNIKDHLEHITRRWGELDRPCLLELSFLAPVDERAFRQAVRYSLDEVDKAVEDAVAFNESGLNCYVTVNPIDASNHGAPGKRSGNEHIVASFFHWADCDDENAFENTRDFVGPKFTFHVMTGTKPTFRPHAYWELTEPNYDLKGWEATQRAIARRLDSDKAVVDPSRIMRLGGTVNYPKPKKAERGYIAEVTAFKSVYEGVTRPHVPSETMARAFNAAAPSTGLQIDTGTHDTKTADHYADILRRARTDGEKHTGVRDLAASLAGSGIPRAMADAIVKDACPVWDEGVIGLLDTAYAKFYKAPVEPSPQAVETDSKGVITGLKLQSSQDFLADLTAPIYVVDGVLAERRCLSLTGYAGHGKTTLALHLAIQVARGEYFGGAECEKGSSLILAGENPDNVKWQYASAVAAIGDNRDLPIHFLPGHFQLSAYLDDLIEKAKAIKDLRLVVIDSLQAFFEGENDNANVEMMDAARRFRKLSEIPSGPTVIVIAHPAGKRPDKSNIVPRGGSAFGNEFDGNLTVWAEPDGTQTFHHTEKFRGAPFEPLNFVMETREFDHLQDHKGRPLRLKVSRQQMQIEAANAAKKSENRLLEACFAIDADPKITVRGMAEKLGVSKSTAERVIENLKTEKLIKRDAKKWKLTSGGKEFCEDE